MLPKGISGRTRTWTTTKKSVGPRNQAQTRNTARMLQGISNERKREGGPMGLPSKEPQNGKNPTIRI